MKTDVEALRKKYMDNPPEGLTSTDIRHMSEEDLLDMDYPCIFYAAPQHLFSLQCPPMRELYHKNRESYAEERFPRDRDIDLSYNSSRERR